MSISIKELIKNTSKGASFLFSRDKIFDSLEDSYGRIYEGIELLAVKRELTDLFVWLKIPSEDEKMKNNIKYDLVIKFLDINNSTHITDDTLVEIFCNAPNFVFTYAYAFNSHGSLIKKYIHLLPILAITQPASARNPFNVVGFIKQIYFAFLYLKLIKFKTNWNMLINNKIITPLSFETIMINIQKEKKGK